jgi:Concanavalin A-like lectin/glucanases superfamily
MAIRTANPVNMGHFLNAGRVSWFLALPHLYGGPTWSDLMGLNPATLTNMTSVSGWRSTTRPGGFGHLQFDGVDDYCLCTNGPALSITGAISVAAWVRLDNVSNPSIWAAKDNNVGGRAYTLDMDNFSGPPVPRFYINGGGGTNEAAGTVPIPQGAWQRYVGMFLPGNSLSIYVNGILAGITSTAVTTIPTATTPLRIGARAYSGAESFTPGAIDDVSVWNRALSASEVRADYELSIRGYPGVLNRY